jgi:20S proteasome subunit alpha 5
LQSRPFGVALLVAGWDDEHGPVLYVIALPGDDICSSFCSIYFLVKINYRFCDLCRFHTDPSGTFVQFKAKAIGSGSEGAQTALQEAYREDMTLEEAEVLALSTLKQVMEEKVTSTNVDMAAVAPEWHLYSTEEVERVIQRL